MQENGDPIMDLITRAGDARAAKLIHRLEEILVIHAVTLSARKIRTVMLPAERVKTFDLRKSLHENLRDLGPDFHRSYPVSHDGDFQNVSGCVLLRDLLGPLADSGGKDWLSLIRPLPETDGNAPVTPLLVRFLEDRDPAALVKKDGQNIGWITLGDITRTLLGARR